ncbi:MAG: InlB B-repeat-containing protein, partial [Candidatus Natronoplasma sp.]
MDIRRSSLAVCVVLLLVGSVFAAVTGYSSNLNDHKVIEFEQERTSNYQARLSFDNSPSMYILVNSTVYEPLEDELTRYKTDVEAITELEVEIIENTFTDPTEIKSFLKEGYENDSLEGVFFVGNLPHAEFEMANDYGEGVYSRFPIDHYYTDLDGVWEDTNNSGAYDDHRPGGGDLDPEIWLGRLSIQTDWADEVALYENYFEKVYQYRRGNLTVEERPLLYIDDDWVPWTDEYKQGLLKLYDNVTIINDTGITRAGDYGDRLQGGYEWVQIHCHANHSSKRHAFRKEGGPKGSGGNFTSADLYEGGHKSLFQNVFTCEAADYTVPDYLCGWYAVTDNYGLGNVGSTKSGSMLEFENYYLPLSEGKSLGEAMQSWWKNTVTDDLMSRSWFYGMTTIGDPVLSMEDEEKLDEYELTVEVEGGGTVDIDPEQDKYVEGMEVKLKADPESGWNFVEWIGDYTGTEENIIILMDENKTITAHFAEEPEKYELTVNVEGEGNVEVDPDQAEYQEGTEVNLTALPGERWSFVEWTGAVPPGEEDQEEITITMDEDKSLTAHFDRKYFFEVDIGEYEERVVENDPVFVDYTVENTGVEEDTQNVEFMVDGIVEESLGVTLAADEIHDGNFAWQTGEGEAGEHELMVASEDDDDRVTVNVTALEEPFFEVEITSPSEGSEYTQGETVTVNYSLENMGKEDTQIIEFTVDGELEDSEEVTLAGEEEHQDTFTWQTEEREAGEHRLKVASEDEEEEVTVTILTTPFAGGSGTEYDPYLIENVYQLQNISEDLDAQYRLANDIDAGVTEDWNDGEGFDPIGDSDHRFTGSLTGSGYAIHGLHMDREDVEDTGLFGVIGEDAEVKDITLLNIKVKGYQDEPHWAGGLAGTNLGLIDNVHVSGDMNGDHIVGGIVGHGPGTIKRSYSTGNVSGNYFTGGLQGTSSGNISSSCSSASVGGNGTVGGLVGGIWGLIKNSYATGDVTGEENIGGLAGQIGIQVTGYTETGEVINCYSVGEVSGGEPGAVGGLVGKLVRGDVSDCFWNVGTTGMISSDGGIGVQTDAMTDEGTFTEAGWDFEEDWDIKEDETYPFLRWQGEAIWPRVPEPVLELEIIDLDEEVKEGEEVTVKYSVTMLKDIEEPESVRFLVYDERENKIHEDSQEVTSEGEYEFTWTGGEKGDYTMVITSEVGLDERTVSVEEEREMTWI